MRRTPLELRVVVGLISGVLVACGPGPGDPPIDSGAGDASIAESDGGVDAGVIDAGTADAGVIDAGFHDGGHFEVDAGSDAGTIDAGQPQPVDAGNDAGLPVDGIIFVHGINGSLNDWTTMINRFKADGFPANRLVAHTYSDPKWGCNTGNADQLSQWVTDLEATGARRIAIVAHSMGGLSSRYYLQRKMGTSHVSVFTTLGTMHHGLTNPCLGATLPICVWKELCSTGSFIADLNMAPATPGPTTWTSIFSTDDTTVPAMSSQLVGADNISLSGLQHDGANGLQESQLVYQLVVDSLH